ncbi:MAG: restriction endonuclease subunit S [Rhodocyclaceae bacterium]|nr:restriction endonuclease subunit S [Rhodocyclaceae bacterium]
MSSEWATLQTIGELLVREGGSIKTGPFGTTLKASEYAETGVPLISVREIGHGTFHIDKKTPRVCEATLARLPEYILQTNDIVFARKGGIERCALVRKPQTGWFLGSDGIRLRPPKSCDARFIAYFLQTKAVKEWLVQNSTGSTMASLNQATIGRIPVSLPSIQEQTSIADTLETLDDRITLLRETNATLEAIAQALFKSWFVDFDPVRAKQEGRVPEGMDEATAALFPDGFEESELGLVPRGWAAANLGKVVSLHGGSIQTGPFGSQLHASDYSEHGIPVVMPKDISNRRIDTTSIARVSNKHVERLSRHQLKVGDIVFSRRGDVERHALVTRHEAGWLCGTGCLLVRPGSSWRWSAYLSMLLDAPQARAWLVQHAVGATMPNLNTGILGSVPMVLPPVSILDQFEQVVMALEDSRSENFVTLSTLADLRDTLLPRLISGQLRLPDTEALIEEVTA